MAKLTPRENWIRFLKGETPEWMPSDRDMVLFLPALLPENIARGKVVQQGAFDESTYGGKDWFGVDWVYDPTVRGSMEVAPLMDEVDEWEEKVVFPDLSKLDWEGCAAENRELLNGDKLVGTMLYTGFFERLISFVGFEKAAMALIDEEEQDTVKALFDKLADFYIEQVRYMKEYLHIEYVELHDDWGTQRGPMMSEDTLREMIVPYVRKFADGIHALGVYFEMHSCGMIEPLIPALIDSGADTWRGQDLNDKLALIRQYGDRFKFGVEIRTIRETSDEELLEIVRKFKEDYAGEQIWLMAGRGLSPAQAKLVYDEVYG